MSAGPETARREAAREAAGRGPIRWLAAIRFDEVLVLQGPPLLGLALGAARAGVPRPGAVLVFLAGSATLVAHVFALNDWSEMDADAPETSGLDRRGMRALWIGLLAASALLFAFLGPLPLLIALGIAALSALYSAPPLRAKGIPLLSSLLHLAGGVLHVLLGHAVVAPPDGRALALASGVAFVFAGGHLTQEVRDHDVDLRNGTRTNAVVFGKAAAFVAGLALFTAGFAALFVLALDRILPRLLAPAIALLWVLHVSGSAAVLRSHLAPARVRRFQWRYRALFAALGIAMAAALVLAR